MLFAPSIRVATLIHSCLKFCLEQGVLFPGKQQLQSAPAHPSAGADHGNFLSFLLTSWPWAASLRSLAFLLPYTCHLFHPGLMGLPLSSLFPALPFPLQHVASIRAKKPDVEKHHALHSRLSSWMFCFPRAGASDGLDHGSGSPCSEME